MWRRSRGDVKMKQIFQLKEPIDKITSPDLLFKNIEKIDINHKQENFLLICLNTANQIIHTEILFKGGLNACLIDPKTIFRTALEKEANTIIVAHNHPSGSLKPSGCDEDVYEKIKAAGKILQLNLLDFIIFNQKEFYSLMN